MSDSEQVSFTAFDRAAFLEADSVTQFGSDENAEFVTSTRTIWKHGFLARYGKPPLSPRSSECSTVSTIQSMDDDESAGLLKQPAGPKPLTKRPLGNMVPALKQVLDLKCPTGGLPAASNRACSTPSSKASSAGVQLPPLASRSATQASGQSPGIDRSWDLVLTARNVTDSEPKFSTPRTSSARRGNLGDGPSFLKSRLARDAIAYHNRATASSASADRSLSTLPSPRSDSRSVSRKKVLTNALAHFGTM